MVARERAASPREVLPGGRPKKQPVADHVPFVVRPVE